MKNLLQMLFTGIEMGNARFGPWLELQGWSKTATRDMSKYDGPLTRIYQRIWRHGSINPFVELGMLVGGSMIMYHAQNKMLRPRPGPRPRPPGPDNERKRERERERDPGASKADVPKRRMRKMNFVPELDPEEETDVK
jgi:hypothetical protein